jgi:hypothetical protein
MKYLLAIVKKGKKIFNLQLLCQNYLASQKKNVIFAQGGIVNLQFLLKCF